MAGACPSDDDESILLSPLEENEFIVEKILWKSIIEGKPHYLVKWKEFPESENSWEPVENLNCDKLLAEFETELAKEESARPVRGKKGGKTSRSVPARAEGRNPREVSARKEDEATAPFFTKEEGRTPRKLPVKGEDRTPSAVPAKRRGRPPRVVPVKEEDRTAPNVPTKKGSTNQPTPGPSATSTAAVNANMEKMKIDNVIAAAAEDPEIVEEMESVFTSLPPNKTPVRVCYMEYLKFFKTFKYLITWRNNTTLQLADGWILSDVFKATYPQIVIAYYETLIAFHDEEDPDETDVTQGGCKAVAHADADEEEKQVSDKEENTSQNQQEKNGGLNLDSGSDADDAVEENKNRPLLD